MFKNNKKYIVASLFGFMLSACTTMPEYKETYSTYSCAQLQNELKIAIGDAEIALVDETLSDISSIIGIGSESENAFDSLLAGLEGDDAQIRVRALRESMRNKNCQ